MEVIEKPDKKEYEISFLTKNEDGISSVLKLVKQHQFEVALDAPVKKISLAYKIKKESQGYFSFLHILGDPESVKTLNQDLKSNSEIIRFLIITPPFKNRPASVGKGRVKLTPSKTEPEIRGPLPLSNEALEKKIEEILQ